MTAASTTKSQIDREFEFWGNAGSTLPVLDLIFGASVVSSNPADLTGAADASAFVSATATVSGVAVGDVVLGVGVVSGLAANSYIVGAYVSATDTITVLVGGKINTSVTTTAMTLNFIVADVT